MDIEGLYIILKVSEDACYYVWHHAVVKKVIKREVNKTPLSHDDRSYNARVLNKTCSIVIWNSQL